LRESVWDASYPGHVALPSPPKPPERGTGSLTDFFARPVFAVEPEVFSWRDVILFTHRRGRWETVLQEITDGLACVDHAEGGDDAIIEETVDAAAAEFRYDRELITADETEAWLREQGLTAAEWYAGIRRGVLYEHFADRRSELRRAAPTSREELEREAQVELLCTGLGRALAESFAEHVAAAAAAGFLSAGPPADQLAGALPAGLTRTHVAARLALIDRILEGGEQFGAAVLTEDAIRREVRLHQMEWVRLECRTVTFSDSVSAREAALCLREDGLGIEEVAAQARREVVEVRLYVDDLDPGLQPLFLSAVPGEVIGPAPVRGGLGLWQIASKTMAAEEDPEIRERAGRRLVARARSNEANRRVQWRIRW
jgi:hypothetical protein